MIERIEIVLRCHNAAFREGGHGADTREIARILGDVARRFADEQLPPAVLRDANGNRVGHVFIDVDND